MVLIYVKMSDESHSFLYETNVNNLIKNLKEDLINIYNLRCKILKLLDASLELAKHGPLRPEEFRGLAECDSYNSNEVTCPDANNFRTGIPPQKDAAIKLINLGEKMKRQLVENGPKNGVSLNNLKKDLDLIVQNIKICYPVIETLPSYEPTRLILEKENYFNDELVPDETSMWWAGKEMDETLCLKNIIGKNEKTKIIIKLNPKKMGPPEREPRIDSETYKAMLSYYHQKKKEEKEFEEDDDDSYLNSEWASPLSLQKQLLGNLHDLKWKP
ncbi:conserved protein, unknown function [Plasmodium vinckei brucechwatti]|uniref:Uncharacterized protein n=1 Tax=Plasmodium vinckei brucechwatti TaxID=119398 RepID=A0A6V7S276_PLAVN|nr:conserved protein, unknown function [Plasmodium vinckei brucechwatti]